MIDDRIEELGKDLLRLMVSRHGGFSDDVEEPEALARECARQARAYYRELEHPTTRKPKEAGFVVREQEEEEEDFDL